MQFTILTLFPELVEAFSKIGVIGRAVATGQLTIHVVNIRDFTSDAYNSVDDTPYGGGAGMVMQVEPIDKALEATTAERADRRKTVVLSARGPQFTQAKAQAFAELDELILICGRYEGIDQRVADHLADEELSVGPYVLAGGELPALLIVEAVGRLLPGVLGNPASLNEESFSPSREYPQYTKPADYKGWKVPEVLLSGNHAKIKKWRAEQQ